MNEIRALEDTIHSYMEKEQIPGAAVAVWKDDQMIYEKGFGYANLEKETAVTARTIFGLASITKSFIALAIMRLEKQGKLHIEDPVKDYLPEFTLQDDRYVEEITIKHLLSHTSGVATYKRLQSLNTFEDHLAYLKEAKTPLLGRPGAYFCYNNDLFLLLGAIIEKVTGQDYRGVIEGMIIKPYDMTRSTFYVEEVLQMEDRSMPYIIENGKVTPCQWPKIGNYAVGGGIRSTAEDLIKYGKQYLRKDKMMRKPQYLLRGRTSYGYGLQITEDYSGRTLIEHGGSQPGVSSNFGFIPEENLVVVLLTNVSGASTADMWLHIVNTFCGLPLDQKRFIYPDADLEPEAFAPFIGSYATGEGATIEIRAKEMQLEAVIEGEVYALRASSDNMLIIEGERPLQFYIDEKAQAWSVLFGVRMFLRQDEKER